MITRTKKALQQEKTPASSSFLTPLSSQQVTALVHMTRNIIKEKLQTHEAFSKKL